MLAAASAQRPVMEVVFSWRFSFGEHFLTIVLMNALRYFYGANIVAKISKLFSQEPQVDIAVTTTDDAAGAPVPELTHSKQVFHVPGNHYTFDDAKAVCAAYGGKLASYNQMEDAYEDGADWCSYGWSEDQMAFFPTQEEKWKKLQKIEGHKHDCGRPGINGGYIANPNVKFGVNCYGYKPDITPYESQLMRESTGLPTTKKDQEFQKLVKEWKKKIPQILISPFNKNEWSSSKNIKSLPTVCYLCSITVTGTWTHFLACLVFLLGCLLPPLRVTRLGLERVALLR